MGVPILDQLPFNGTERDPKPEEIAQALSLQRSDVVANWETRRAVQRFPVKFLFEKAHYFWDNIDLQDFEEVLALLIYGMCYTVAEPDCFRKIMVCILCFVFAKCRGKQESPSTFILSSWKEKKDRKFTFSRF